MPNLSSNNSDKVTDQKYKETNDGNNIRLFLFSFLFSIGMVVLAFFVGASDYTKGNSRRTFSRSESILKFAVIAGGIAVFCYLIQQRYYGALAVFLGLIPVILFTVFYLAPYGGW